MKDTVYLETTILSYLTAKPSRDPVILGRQTLTREWWRVRRGAFRLVISDMVLQEIQAGDSEAARRRLELANGIPALPVTEESVALAELLISEGPIPPDYREDALHIAVCAAHGVDYLLTWNCRHLANAAFRFDIESLVAREGFLCSAICTPEELMEA